MIMFGRVYGAAIAAVIFAACTALKLDFMHSITITVVVVAVLGIARPHVMAFTSKITERALALKSRMARQPKGSSDAPGA
jgi:hypothetical protein